MTTDQDGYDQALQSHPAEVRAWIKEQAQGVVALLRELRTEYDSDAELALALDVWPATLSKILNGKRLPGWIFYAKLGVLAGLRHAQLAERVEKARLATRGRK